MFFKTMFSLAEQTGFIIIFQLTKYIICKNVNNMRITYLYDTCMRPTSCPTQKCRFYVKSAKVRPINNLSQNIMKTLKTFSPFSITFAISIHTHSVFIEPGLHLLIMCTKSADVSLHTINQYFIKGANTI